MKLNTKSIAASFVFIAAVCANMVGCVSQDVSPLTGGFQEVTYTHTSLSEPSAHRVSLQYRSQEGKQVMIWPSLFGVRSVIKGDTAIFIGDQVRRHPPSNELAPYPRLFAVKAAGPPLDITDEVLWRWSKKSGEDFAQIAKEASITYPKEEDNGVTFYFASGPDVHLDWNQLADVMREVKENGIQRIDPKWKVVYIEKEFKPEGHQ